ncbi:hypothetical protein Tco_1302877 [Tanacetum coccineum]
MQSFPSDMSLGIVRWDSNFIVSPVTCHRGLILDIKFGKSPSEFDHPIENPSEINLLEIIDVPGEDDDISDDEDPLPHDLVDSDVEDLINDDDGVEKVYSSEEED